jgi:hypothetical protein
MEAPPRNHARAGGSFLCIYHPERGMHRPLRLARAKLSQFSPCRVPGKGNDGIGESWLRPACRKKGSNNHVRNPQDRSGTECRRLPEICQRICTRRGCIRHTGANGRHHEERRAQLQRLGESINDAGIRVSSVSQRLASFLTNSRCCVMYSWTTCRASIVRGSRSPCCASASSFWSEAGASCLCRMVERGLQLADYGL